MRGLCLAAALLLVLVPLGTGSAQAWDSPEPVRDYFVDLYWTVLHGPPAPAELEWNVELAYAHGEVKTLTVLLLLSPEFLGGPGSDPAEFVRVLHMVAFDRDPDADEVELNVERLVVEGESRFDLVMEFLDSPTFTAKDPLR